MNDDGRYPDVVSCTWRPRNPKLVGSPIAACRPQRGTCPGQCVDCFFRGGRYYEDIQEPHVPFAWWVKEHGKIVRMNDGNDSNHQRDIVMRHARVFPDVFFNTHYPHTDFGGLGPCVLTVNGDHTDSHLHLVGPDKAENLMAVRVRVNTWNLDVARMAIDHYAPLGVPVLLTYMAYFREEVEDPESYCWKERTLNPYWCIAPEARVEIEAELGAGTSLVRTCTALDSHECRDCLNCVDLYRRWEKTW